MGSRDFGTVVLDSGKFGDDGSRTQSSDFPVHLYDKCFAVEEGFELSMMLKIRKSDDDKWIYLEEAAAIVVTAYSDRLCLPIADMETSDDSDCTFRAHTEGEQPVVVGGQTASNATDITINFLYKCKAGPCKCGECRSSPAPNAPSICESQFARTREDANDRRRFAKRPDHPPTLAPFNQPGSTFPCCVDGQLGPSGGDEWCMMVFNSEDDQYGDDGEMYDSPISNAFKKAYDDAMKEVTYCCKMSGLPKNGDEAMDAFQDAWSEAAQSEDCTSAK